MYLLVGFWTSTNLPWAKQYLDALIQRDVHDVAAIEKLDQLPQFLRALAHTAGQMCNYSQLGGNSGIDGDLFKMGVLLYDGTETVPLGDRIWAAPLSTLWGDPSGIKPV